MIMVMGASRRLSRRL